MDVSNFKVGNDIIMVKDSVAREESSKALEEVSKIKSFSPSVGDNVAWIGDSWGAGTGVLSGQAYPEIVSKIMGFNSKNYCVGGSGFIRKAGGTGDTFFNQLSKVEEDNDTYNFKYLFVMGGFNDINHGSVGSDLYQAERNFISEISTKLKGVVIVWCGFNLRCQQITRDFRDGYDYSHNAPFIAGGNPIIVVNNWQWALVGKTQYYNPDLVHPNVTGHTIIANSIISALLGQNIEYRLLISRPELSNGSLWNELNANSDEFYILQDNGDITIHFPSFTIPDGFTGAFIASNYTIPLSARPITPQTVPIYVGNTTYNLFLMINTDGKMYVQNRPSTVSIALNTTIHIPCVKYPMYSPAE